MEYEFSIPGKPIAKKRPRFAVRNGKGIAYNGQSTEEGKVILQLQKESEWIGLIKKPVRIDFCFWFPRPKNHFKSNNPDHDLKENAPIYHMQKPDIDNLIKFYLDCMNGIIIEDDKQVVYISATKEFSGNNYDSDTFIKIIESED